MLTGTIHSRGFLTCHDTWEKILSVFFFVSLKISTRTNRIVVYDTAIKGKVFTFSCDSSPHLRDNVLCKRTEKNMETQLIHGRRTGHANFPHDTNVRRRRGSVSFDSNCHSKTGNFVYENFHPYCASIIRIE